jgi:hypothetical protein
MRSCKSKEIDDNVPMYVEKGRALLFHLAAMVDVNECALEWLPDAERAAYYKKLFKAMALGQGTARLCLDGQSSGGRRDYDQRTAVQPCACAAT